MGVPGELTLPFLLDIQLCPALDADLPNLEDGMKKPLGFNAGLARAIGPRPISTFGKVPLFFLHRSYLCPAPGSHYRTPD